MPEVWFKQRKEITMRTRVVSLEFVRADQVKRNETNWRSHGNNQTDAMRSLLEEIGFADALIARKTSEGELVLIDGHMRADIMRDQMVPVLVVDLSEHEADKLLLVLDPIAAMAETNLDAASTLFEELMKESSDLSEYIGDLSEKKGVEPPDFEPVDVDSQGDIDVKKKCTCKDCGHEFAT